jgi:hypothetical protein
MFYRLRLSCSVLLACALFIAGTSLVAAQTKPSSPTAANCSLSPVGAYDPTCDVDHDGDIDIVDIQLVAGRWNQTGSYVNAFWSLAGNGGTDPSTNYIGTTDGQPLIVQPAGGYVGIGTTAPQAPLNVVGTTWFQGDSTPLPASAGQGIAVGFGGDQGYIFGFDYGTFTPKNLLLQNPGGNVGIGTLSPTAGKLHVDGGSNTAVYATSTNGIGTYAVSGTNAAVYGYSTSDYGVDGRSFNSIGVYGQSYSSGGMWGLGPYIGVQGNSTGTDVNRQAIRGDNNGSTTGYAGLFYGNTWVAGTFFKNAGAFRIDHPLDPANKYLNHSFVESPDMKNIYDGVVTLDATGAAVVELPAWFEALNKDFRYQLTAIGAPAPGLYIAKEVQDNRFSIAGGAPGMKVSWQVTGIRHDPYAEMHRIPVEEDKPADARGTYIFPEGYGKSHDAALPVLRAPLNPAPER